MVMKAMSVDLMKEGIGVVMLHPGHVQTEMGGLGAGTAITTTESVQGNRRTNFMWAIQNICPI